MKEKALRFGKTAPLVGIVCEPSRDAARPDLPAVVLLNSGILHRAGASRLHVQIARSLAEAGIVSLRFDFSGIGDSEPRKDALKFEQSAPLETREAMDYLTASRGAREFVLIGLCSGADMAFRVALEDPRVVGLVQLDAWAYRTLGYYVRHYGPKIGRPEVWARFFARLVRAGAGGGEAQAARPTEDYQTPEYRRKFPPRETVAAGLRALAERRVRMLNIFSGGQEEHYNHRAQYERSFRSIDFRGLLRVEYMGTADHIFTGLEHQRRVVEMITGWMQGGSVARERPAEPVPLVAGARG